MSAAHRPRVSKRETEWTVKAGNTVWFGFDGWAHAMHFANLLGNPWGRKP